MSANDIQVGGDHYSGGFQHWDFIEEGGLGYLEGCATKYLSRWRMKNGIQDLEKASHFTQKLLELHKAGKRNPTGDVSIPDVDSYLEANGINEGDGGQAIRLLSRWTGSAQLIKALKVIQDMIKREERDNG